MARTFCIVCSIYFALIISFTANSQLTKEDSLKSNIFSSSTPAARLKNTLAFCDTWESLNPDTLKKYALLAKQLTVSQHNQRSSLLADYYLAAWLFQVNKIDTALALTDKTISLYKQDFSYDDIYAKLMALKGNILLRTDRAADMMAHNFSFIKMAEEHSDTLNMARGTLGIGNVNLRLKKYDEALNWYHKALLLMNNDVFKRKLGFIYNNIAIIFYHLDEEDSAIYYVKKGIQYSAKDENYTNLANAYFLYGGLLAEYKQINEAEAAFKKAIEMRRKTGDIYYIITDMSQLALFYYNNNEPQKDIALCKEGLELLKNNGNDYINQNSLYDVLARNYLAIGDYKNYSNALLAQLSLKDSIYEKNSAEDITEMQAKYDAQKRENVIMQQNFAIAKKNYLLIGSLILLLVVISAAYFIFRENKRRQKIKTQIMLQDEKRKANQAVLEAEDAERKRIAADLHDSLGTYAASIASNIDHVNLLPADENSAVALQELRLNSQSIVSELADTIWVLKKNALPVTAISDRLKNLLQRLQRSYPDIQIEVEENIITDIILSPSQAFHLFHIVSEAVNNAVKHSSGNQVFIKIFSDNNWRFCVEDKGVDIQIIE